MDEVVKYRIVGGSVLFLLATLFMFICANQGQQVSHVGHHGDFVATQPLPAERSNLPVILHRRLHQSHLSSRDEHQLQPRLLAKSIKHPSSHEVKIAPLSKQQLKAQVAQTTKPAPIAVHTTKKIHGLKHTTMKAPVVAVSLRAKGEAIQTHKAPTGLHRRAAHTVARAASLRAKGEAIRSHKTPSGLHRDARAASLRAKGEAIQMHKASSGLHRHAVHSSNEQVVAHIEKKTVPTKQKHLIAKISAQSKALRHAKSGTQTNYYVQIGSFAVIEHAHNLSERLKHLRFSTFIKRATRKNGKTMYIVMVGPTRQLAQANALKSVLHEQIKLNGMVVAQSSHPKRA